jgi:hypothetical protein
LTGLQELLLVWVVWWQHCLQPLLLLGRQCARNDTRHLWH